MPAFNQTPDQPQPFGYKVSWFAVKAADPVSVLDVLEFGERTPANWSSGLAAVYGGSGSDERWVFVSPPVNGWVLAVSSSWPYPTVETHNDIGKKFDVMFSRLTKRFDDVQFFGSHRVADFAAWARAQNGAPTRILAWNGSEGQVFMNLGDQTPEEAQLNLVDLSGLSPDEATDEIFRVAEEEGEKQDEEEKRLVAGGLRPEEAYKKVLENRRPTFPDEDVVVNLAALWSVDPAQLPEQGHPPGLGLAARLPDDLRQ
jgi:hypothetical protein